MTDQEVYKETTVTSESPLLDEEVQDQIKDAAQDVVDESAQAAQERARTAIRTAANFFILKPSSSVWGERSRVFCDKLSLAQKREKIILFL